LLVARIEGFQRGVAGLLLPLRQPAILQACPPWTAWELLAEAEELPCQDGRACHPRASLFTEPPSACLGFADAQCGWQMSAFPT